MPNFQKFRRAYVSAAPGPLVAIHVRGIFALNLKAFEALGEPKAVELLYDPEERLIGLQPAERNAPDSYSVRSHKGHNHQVAAKSFMSHYGIPLDEVGGRRYRAEMVDGVLAVDLKQDPD